MNDKRTRRLPDHFGVVVIGRNEGERLRRCLESCNSQSASVIYVDSGSTDASLDLARRQRVTVVNLDLSAPFSAARARNVGYKRLRELSPEIHFVQFVDGDCEIAADWLPHAVDSLRQHSDVAIVAGRLKERYPEASIYNRLGDIEWNSSGAGAVDSVGGIFMVRCQAFDDIGGFDPTVTAGEEPELCLRLIRQGWRIFRLEKEMAIHDLSMMHFSQWWRRMVRAGYGSMDVGCRFGVANFSKNNYRVLAWSLWLIAIVVSGTLATVTDFSQLKFLTALLLCFWPAQLIRITLRMLRKKHSWDISIAYAFFMTIVFLPQAVGQARYLGDRLLNRSARLIEYKSPMPSKNG